MNKIINIPAILLPTSDIIRREFLTDWSDEQYKDVLRQTKVFFNVLGVHYVCSTFGLPYTSSSAFALLGNTNSNLKFAYSGIEPSGILYSFDHVALSQSGKAYFGFCDNYENYIYFTISDYGKLIAEKLKNTADSIL